MTDSERDKLRIIVCRVDERAEVIEIEDSLKAMQEVVGGLIQEYMPFEDEVALIVNVQSSLMCSIEYSFLELLEIACIQI